MTSSESAGDRLGRVTAGAVDWLARSLPFFDPFSPGARASPHGKVKAALELALLRHCWARSSAGDGRLKQADALVEALWRLPDFQHLVISQPQHTGAYELIYVALAPEGIGVSLRDATIALLEKDGYLTSAGKSSYLSLETKFYADKAGLESEIESYPELIDQSILVRLPAEIPCSLQDTYTITHTSFYLSDFGAKRPDLAPDRVVAAASLAGRMLDHCVRQDLWDLTAELIITLFCLGGDPLNTPAGLAAIRCLEQAQRPDGVIPGRSAAKQPDASATPGEFFHKCYHTTIAVLLMSAIVSSNRGTHVI
jgi:hypothetical protein